MLELSFTERWRIYETVVFMAWGDERLAPSEVSAARVVAEELDLDSVELAPGAVLRAGPPVLADVGLDELSRARPPRGLRDRGLDGARRRLRASSGSALS